MKIPSFDLKGQTALVTGSSRGIGKAIAFILGSAGAHIHFHGTGDSQSMRTTLAEAHSLGISCDVFYADLGSSLDVHCLSNSASDSDILVLNASVQSYGHIADFEDEEFDRILQTNLRSSFQLMKAFAPKMQALNRGRIIVIGSVNQAHPAPRLAIYASSKAACRALVLTAAKEYAPFGITVNTITPGIISTERNAKALSDPAFASSLCSSIPAGRFGTAEDCAGAVLLLASNAGSYITGANIVIDGGFSL